nr:MAG TPA: hypothetical protein [Caudoviricetes sp.]
MNVNFYLRLNCLYRRICCKLIPDARRASSVIARDIRWN